MTINCEYGCGQPAHHQFKSGKWCCSKTTNKCPAVRKKSSEKIQLQYENGRESNLKGHKPKNLPYIERYGEARAAEVIEKMKRNHRGGGTANTVEKEKERCNKLRAAINKRYSEGWEATAGRCKKIDYISSIAGEVKLDGSWELKVAQYFDDNNINWRRNKQRFDYIDSKDKKRTYCPDFYLIDESIYIEVKGYTTELDKCKWIQFPLSLEVWDKSVLVSKKILK